MTTSTKLSEQALLGSRIPEGSLLSAEWILRTLNLTNRAYEFLRHLQSRQYKQLANKIFSLTKDPFPQDCKHLSRHPGMRRVDVGEYRICYEVKESYIEIVVVGSRNDDAVYRKLGSVLGCIAK